MKLDHEGKAGERADAKAQEKEGGDSIEDLATSTARQI
jgi:hypothetical protein